MRVYNILVKDDSNSVTDEIVESVNSQVYAVVPVPGIRKETE